MEKNLNKPKPVWEEKEKCQRWCEKSEKIQQKEKNMSKQVYKKKN